MSEAHDSHTPSALPWNLTERQAASVERAYTDGKMRLLGAYLPMGILLFLAFAPWDYAMSPETAPTTIGIRLVLSFSLLVFWLGRSSRFVRRWYDWIVPTLLTLGGVGVAVVLTIIPGGFATASGGIALVIMFGAGAVRIPAVHTIIVSVAICAATVLLMYATGESTALVGSTALMLASFGALGVFYNASSRRDALSVLVSQSQLRAEKEQSDSLLRQVTTMRAERLTWLENLARFLRHELSNQIVAVSTSIELAASDGSAFGSQTYLERAQRSLGRMRGLVSSATEATSLEAALTVEELERVDLSGVVMDRVTAFQDLHPSRHFTLKLRPGLSIDGNEARVAQLLDKLLSNAVEHSAEDAEIRVNLGLADRGWLELSVENEGDALPEDRARIFEAFVSSQKSAENLGLGLFVAQRIALNHGGQIRAEELRQGSGARFAVSLPKARGEGRGTQSEEGHSARGERAKAVEDQPPQ
jgi:signal transduction histidine kinase